MDLFSEQIFLTCHSRKSPGVANDINNGCITFSFTSSKALVMSILTQWHGLMGHFKMSGAIINVINCTCSLPAMTIQNVCCEEGLQPSQRWDVLQGALIVPVIVSTPYNICL